MLAILWLLETVFLDSIYREIRMSEILRAEKSCEAMLDEEDFITDSYVLEVSSPGLGRPLKKEKDYVRNAGCAVEIHLYKAQDGEKDFEGILKAWDADTVTIAIDEAEEITFRKTDIALIRQAIEF